MAKSISDWLAEGEQLYAGTMEEYKELEVKRNEMRRLMEDKLAELNRLGAVINKPQIEYRPKSSSGTVVGTPVITKVINPNAASPAQPASMMSTANTIARAIQGREFGR